MQTLSRQLTLSLTAAAFLMTTSALQAGVVASWNFDSGTISNAITSDTDSVAGLNATQNTNDGANDPVYVAGNGGGSAAGFAGISGVLEVDDPTGILTGHNNGGTGFDQLTIEFDVDMSTVSSSTWVLVRNGGGDTTSPGTAYNIYTNGSGKIGVRLGGAAGSDNLQVNTNNAVLSAAAGWQHVKIDWTGQTLQIIVDGVAQALNTVGNPTTATSTFTNLRASDARFGIGGIVRASGTTGQYLDGAIDNLVISSTAFVPEPATLALAGLGGLALIHRRK